MRIPNDNENLKEPHLSNFFNRICYRNGRTVAISATTRKLAEILWNNLSRQYRMVVKQTPYKPPNDYHVLDEKRKLGLVKRIRNQIDKFALTIEDLG